MHKSEFTIQNFLNIQEMIRLLDQKSNVLLVIYGIIVSLFVSIIQETHLINISNIESLLLKYKAIFLFLITIGIIVLLNIQIYILLFKIMKPRTANHYLKDSKSLFYYKHISEMEKQDFIKLMSNASEHKLDQVIHEQIYEVSKIAVQKQSFYNKLSIMLFITFNLLFIYIVLVKI